MTLKMLVAGLLVSCALIMPAVAQDATGRIDALENQLRQLTGQVEELTFSVRRLQKQLAADHQTGQAEPQPAAPALARKKLDVAAVQPGDGVETIGEAPVELQKSQEAEIGASGSIYDAPAAAPAATVLGSMDNRAAKPNDGGYQGKLIEQGGDAVVAQDSFENQSANDGIEQVALAQQSPQALFEQANEALLQRKFSIAQRGFQQLLQNYPDHSLAGSAQYWLGETYFVQGDYREAAQNFLSGYQKYKSGRRAPDSLVKLGVSLAKMGQQDQACASLNAVASEYPKALEAKRRASTELKRAGC